MTQLKDFIPISNTHEDVPCVIFLAIACCKWQAGNKVENPPSFKISKVVRSRVYRSCKPGLRSELGLIGVFWLTTPRGTAGFVMGIVLAECIWCIPLLKRCSLVACNCFCGCHAWCFVEAFFLCLIDVFVCIFCAIIITCDTTIQPPICGFRLQYKSKHTFKRRWATSRGQPSHDSGTA